MPIRHRISRAIPLPQSLSAFLQKNFFTTIQPARVWIEGAKSPENREMC